ncbi:hypothetical protein ZIOFF_064639 [Zingiber officinale]|uniref:Myb-like domain-containing protein n=1 Tax=Zingiber officinale TaxID=94328 RepID=A0A8J5EW64_ZINOF|nr:hypothetical protein ZIOFF_064639 [Zingiber officinale]
MSHPYFTSSVVHGYGTPLTTGMSFTPLMSNEPVTLTFVPETQLSNRESPIEVTNLEKAVSNAEGTRKRSSWTKVEDEVLARSFVTISDDPIIDNDKKADAFWGRVASYYNENLRLSSNTRSANVIRSHWHNTIQKKFVDHIVATKKTRTSESGASNTSSNQDMSIDLDYEDTRPMGQNTAKRKGKDKMQMSAKNLNDDGKSFNLKLQSSDFIFDNLKAKIQDEEGISITFGIVHRPSKRMQIFVDLTYTSRSSIITLQVKSSDTIASVKALGLPSAPAKPLICWQTA